MKKISQPEEVITGDGTDELEARLEFASESDVKTSCIGNSLYLAGVVPELTYVEPPVYDFLYSGIFLKIEEPEKGCLVASILSSEPPLKSCVLNMGVIVATTPVNRIAFRQNFGEPVIVGDLDCYLSQEHSEYSIEYHRVIKKFDSIQRLDNEHPNLIRFRS